MSAEQDTGTAATALYLVRGREAPSETGVFYEATVIVRMQTDARGHDRERELRVVAERAVYAAAGAYAYSRCQVTSARLEKIEADDA